MTATAMPSAPAGRAQPIQAAKRVKPARWRDARLALGVVLVLVSVLVGSRLVGSADRTTPYIALAADLPAGHVLASADLVQVRSRLSALSSLYIPWTQSPKLVGRTLSRAVAAGELVPLNAVARALDPTRLRDVPIVVEGLRAPKVHAGDIVDIYATTRSTSREDPAVTAPVVLGVEVVGELANKDSSVKVRLVVRVPKEVVTDLVRATQVSDIDVVEHLPASQR